MKKKKDKKENQYYPREDYAEYKKCVDFLQGRSLYTKVNKAYQFYEDRGWGANPEGFPSANFITNIVNYKVGTICQNGLTLAFEPGPVEDAGLYESQLVLANKMSDLFTQTAEQTDLDGKSWEVNIAAAVSGLGVAYSYWNEEAGKIEMEVKCSTEVMFSNEQETDVQKQEYIFLPYRDTVSNIKRIAKEQGVPEEDIERIASDDETTYEAGDMAKDELDTGEGKVQCVIKLWKCDGEVWMKKFTEQLVFYPETNTTTTLYPIALLPWTAQKGWCRGAGEVYEKIANQIEVNKHYARMSVINKQHAYPKKVVNTTCIEDVDALDEFGSTIEITGNPQEIANIIGYLPFPTVSADAIKYASDIMTITKENAGASDAALANVNLSNTSGAAIVAAKDSAATTLNYQNSRFKTFMEDLGKVWWDIYTYYRPNGIEVSEIQTVQLQNGQTVEIEVISQVTREELENANLMIKINTSPTTPYSKYAEEQTLENLLAAGHIAFENYVVSLPEGSIAPKDKLLKVVEGKRQLQIMQQQYELQMQQLMQVIAEMKQAMEYATAQRNEYQGKSTAYDDLSQKLPQLAQIGEQVLSQFTGQNGTQSAETIANGNA
ncbi:MAG: hypothetical protein R3Y18_00140 [Bacillota bacterium]